MTDKKTLAKIKRIVNESIRKAALETVSMTEEYAAFKQILELQLKEDLPENIKSHSAAIAENVTSGLFEEWEST